MKDTIHSRCVEAQQSVIGAMLIDDRCIGEVLTKISAEDFTSGPCKTVFSCIKQLFCAGKPVDPVIVSHHLDEAYRDFIAQCMEVTPTAANVLQYCELLRTDSRLLRLRDLGLQLTSADGLDAVRALAAKINALLVDQSGVVIWTAADLARDFMERMGSQEMPEYIPIGIPAIDEKVFIEAGDLVGIGAAPSTGKTAFALQWATTASKKYRVGFFSLETGPRKAEDRIFTRAAEIPLSDIKKRILPEEAWARIANACSTTSELKLEFIPAQHMTAADIMSLSVSRQYQIIFVDYLQLVAGADKRQSLYESVTDTSKTFHMSAQRNGITVVLLSQLSRPQKEKGKYLPPDMHSFRESGQIEQDLDLALLLSLTDPDNYRSERRLKIGKNKEGEKGVVDLAFDGRFQTFSVPVKNSYSEIKRIGAAARRELEQMSLEEQYAALERAGKFEEVDDEVPF